MDVSLQTLTILKEFSLQYKRFFRLVHLFMFFLPKQQKTGCLARKEYLRSVRYAIYCSVITIAWKRHFSPG